MINKKEFEDFTGKKLDKITLTFSFRLSINQIEQVLDKKPIEISIKDQKFELVKK